MYNSLAKPGRTTEVDHCSVWATQSAQLPDRVWSLLNPIVVKADWRGQLSGGVTIGRRD